MQGVVALELVTTLEEGAGGALGSGPSVETVGVLGWGGRQDPKSIPVLSFHVI